MTPANSAKELFNAIDLSKNFDNADWAIASIFADNEIVVASLNLLRWNSESRKAGSAHS